MENNTATQVIEDGRLIAEFMGLMVFRDQAEASACPIDELKHWLYEHQTEKYHTSWDWLMPVVEKIVRDKNPPMLPMGGLEKSIMPYLNACRAIKAALLHVDIAELHQAVIIYILWYNQQTPTP